MSLITLDQASRCNLCAVDGEVGRLCDIYFEPDEWRITHLVFEHSSWFRRRRIVVPSPAFSSILRRGFALWLPLSKRQLLNAPKVDTVRLPDCRQEGLLRRYFWEMACGGRTLRISEHIDRWEGNPWRSDAEGVGRRTLCSAFRCINYPVYGASGERGHLDDLLIETEAWDIRYLGVEKTAPQPAGITWVSSVWVQRIDTDKGGLYLSGFVGPGDVSVLPSVGGANAATSPDRSPSKKPASYRIRPESEGPRRFRGFGSLN